MSSSLSPEAPSASRASAWRALFALERRELARARPTLLLLALAGPLVGHAFATAVATYAEASGAGGGPAALAQGLSPLDGLVVPTLGAYALLATLILPFAAIHTLATDKRSGALGFLLQSNVDAPAIVLTKLAGLAMVWLVAMVPGLVALVMWRVYGGHLGGAETWTVLLGHTLRGLFTIALALAAAAIAESASSAAIIVLAITLGGWALDFVAQVKGGLAQRLAAFTPEAALRTFESGELRLSLVLVTITLTIAAVALAAIAVRSGRSLAARVRAYALLAVFAIVGPSSIASWRGSIDASEDRRNSFAPTIERALSTLGAPLIVRVNLAPEDPRLADLEREVLRKLRRVVPHLELHYASRGSTGLFERPGSGYGEVWYEMQGRRAMSRSTTEPIVLETIFGVAGIAMPSANGGEPAYRGYPFVAKASGVAIVFYVVWPVLVTAGWFLARRR